MKELKSEHTYQITDVFNKADNLSVVFYNAFMILPS